jgi:hypothetical protein
MAKNEERKEPILSLDGEEYFAEDMSAEQMQIINHLTDISRKLSTNLFVGEQLQVNRNAFVDMFRNSLKQDDKKEVESAEVVEA